MRDWRTYLHEVRRREIDEIFGRCPEKIFAVGLELGAGDGYQSGLLEVYTKRLVVTDWNVEHLVSRQSATVEVQACDAERVAETFPPSTFDLVFSSNLLEHLPLPGAALRGVHRILKDDGVTVHVVPSPAWKLCDLGLYVPAKAMRVGARVLHNRRHQEPPAGPTSNPKVEPRRNIGPWRIIWPGPHGAYRGNWQELWAFRRSRWIREFEAAGFRVVAVSRGPVASGYGFGWDRLRDVLDRLAVATEYVYVAVKRNGRSPYDRYFMGRVG